MTDKLNEKERTVHNLLRPELGNRAVISQIKHDKSSDRIAVHVISPTAFPWTANQLPALCQRAAEATGCDIDVTLAASWTPERALA